jgi:NAD(P)-dependent dehydrogenase (short-subunit alcohol dehydrogenase family)
MPFGDFPLKGKIAAVTGAGSGINLSFAKLAVAQGARVIVADLKLTDEGEKFMKGEGAKAAVFTKCDVTRRADLENLITVSEKEFGDVPDIYIAGAGVFEPSWSNFWGRFISILCGRNALFCNTLESHFMSEYIAPKSVSRVVPSP